MSEDEKGFRYPQIDYDRCNKCGLCDAVCAFNDRYKHNGGTPAVYAVKHRDEAVRRSSTSGGMFTAISDKVLDEGGVVYGAGFKDRLVVCHKRAATKEDRDEFKGSKYVQCDTGDIFSQVKKDLDSNVNVLFTGTPCQVTALKSFLRRGYDNLLTVDFVCHGTPSNKLWQDFLDVIEKDTNDKVVFAEFRNKEVSWLRPKTKLHLKAHSVQKLRGEQSYFQLFVNNYMLMPACHNCMYSNFSRASDITLGDFWGIQKTLPEFDDDKGVSLVLVNSSKGTDVFEFIKDGLEVRESCQQNCLQRNLQNSPPKHEKSDEFWEDYQNKGMRFVMIKYTDYSAFRTFIRKAVNKIKRHSKEAIGIK